MQISLPQSISVDDFEFVRSIGSEIKRSTYVPNALVIAALLAQSFGICTHLELLWPWLYAIVASLALELVLHEFIHATVGRYLGVRVAYSDLATTIFADALSQRSVAIVALSPLAISIIGTIAALLLGVERFATLTFCLVTFAFSIGDIAAVLVHGKYQRGRAAPLYFYERVIAKKEKRFLRAVTFDVELGLHK